jgi:hypothetical protein
MKKIIGLAIAGVAMMALSGCNTTGSTPGASVTKIDIENLEKGYEILGDGSKGKQVSIEFCYGRYTYRRNGQFVQKGDVNIVNGKIQLSKIDMLPDAGGSYAIETDTGYLRVGDAYEIAGVEWIDPLTAISKINCY